MKTHRLLAGSLTLSAVALALTSVAFAQTSDSSTGTAGQSTTGAGSTSGQSTTTGQSSSGSFGGTSSGTTIPSDGKPWTMTTTSGQTVVMVGPNTSAGDKEKVRWSFYNADRASVKMLAAHGFSEGDSRAILNLAQRTGFDVDYIVRRVKDSGYPLATLATMLGVNTQSLNADLPGFNADAMAIMGGDMAANAATMAYSSTSSTAGSSAMAARGDIMDVAMSDPQLSTFVAAVRAAGLTDTLKGAGPYTIFAPTNGAFAKLPAGTLDDLLKPENRDRLASILQNHVLSGRVTSRDIGGMSNPSSPTTLGGGSLSVKTTSPVMINDAGVVQADLPATNGVIHLVDSVLLPSGAGSGTSGAGSSTTTPAPDSGTSTPATPAPEGGTTTP